MSKMKKILLATAAMMAVANNEKMDFIENPVAGMSFNPNYKVRHPHRELKEFSIKGNKIMAYSKKDAIKRLKHLKKI